MYCVPGTLEPIGLNGGVNVFGYVGGNPIIKIDPLGEDFLDLFKCTYYGYLLTEYSKECQSECYDNGFEGGLKFAKKYPSGLAGQSGSLMLCACKKAGICKEWIKSCASGPRKAVPKAR